MPGPLIGLDFVDWMLDEQRLLKSTLERFEAGDPVELIEQLSWGRYGNCAFTLRQTALGTLTPTLIPQSLGPRHVHSAGASRCIRRPIVML